jgi:hypothetical protein
LALGQRIPLQAMLWDYISRLADNLHEALMQI